MLTSDYNKNPVLRAAFEHGKLSHAYITGASELSEKLAAAAVCGSDGGGKPCGECSHCRKAARGVHPDIITISQLPDKREILVDQIRAVKEDIIVVPNESDKKAYIINNADSMNKAAQNALLTMLEEPPTHAVFILTAENPAELLATVRSRCVEIKSAGQPEYDSAGDSLTDDFFTALESGIAELAAFSFRLDRSDKSELAAFFAHARVVAAEKMNHAVTCGDETGLKRYNAAEKTLRRAEEYLALNVGTVHISGLICASLT